MKSKQLKFSVFMILVLLIGMRTVAHAQSTFGIRGGLNASNVSFDNLPNRSERFGYHLGVFADVPVVSDFMSVQPELSYSVKGAAFEYLNEHRKLNMKYVDFLIPVAFHLSSIDIQVGPFVSLLTSTPDYTVYNENRVLVDAFKSFDIGLTAGLSFNYNHFLFGIRYNQGLVDVTKDNSRPLLGSGKNAVGQASLGYRF